MVWESIISVSDLVKIYHLYEKPSDRVKETFSLKKKKYSRDFYALNGISFDVKKGETVGIIGTNGAGKSTLLKIITGVLEPSAGTITVNGKISALLELGAGFNQEYTGIQNIYLNGRMMGFSKKEMDDKLQAIIEFADIGDFINQPVKTYSSGMFARLAFAVAINVEPDILIVDEALSVGDLFFQNKCFRKFEELKERNVTILFVSHDISSVRQMCSRVLWIEHGGQKMFADSETVCDMYMDMKRKDMNEMRAETVHSGSRYLTANIVGDTVTFPRITWKNSGIQSDKVDILSFFVLDDAQNFVNSLEVDQNYSFHVVVRLNEDLKELIVGLVVENNKGIPLYDLNNYINSGKVICGKKNETIEVIFWIKLPRIMKGEYLVSTAVAQGTQEEHVMLTWLHGVQTLEIINMGYNSSYIELPAEVHYNKYKSDQVNLK